MGITDPSYMDALLKSLPQQDQLGLSQGVGIGSHFGGGP